jgi:2,3-dihydroxyphenylpropionate 1,2-dioxygenase
MSAQGPQIATVALSHSPQMAQDTGHLQGRRFRAGFAQVANTVADYQPTLAVYFGPDHMRALAGIAPCFTVVEAASGYGDWGTPQEDYQVPHERAVALGEHLAAAGIDIALAPHLRLDHGFGQSTSDLFGSLSAVPLIPIVINCVDRPLPTAARSAALGNAVGEFLRRKVPGDERVLVIGSGGISHAPPSLIPGARDLTEEQRQRLITDNLARAAEAINPGWDEQFLATLASTDWTRLASLSPEDLAPAGTGGAEVRTWIAAAFTGGTPLSTVIYEPVTEWITGMGIAASETLSAG